LTKRKKKNGKLNNFKLKEIWKKFQLTKEKNKARAKTNALKKENWYVQCTGWPNWFLVWGIYSRKLG
jgi:hypothetical protein